MCEIKIKFETQSLFFIVAEEILIIVKTSVPSSTDISKILILEVIFREGQSFII